VHTILKKEIKYVYYTWVVKIVVPLKKADIEVSIRGFIANVTSDLHYMNDTDENIETEFVFPLDTNSAIYKFEAKINDRTIVAEIQEKSQVNFVQIKISYIK
jgi:hypothetical protein